MSKENKNVQVDMAGAKAKVGAKTKVEKTKETVYTYEQFIEDFLKIEMPKNVSGKNKDRQVIVSFIGYTGMSIASTMKAHIEHANKVDGLGNIKSYIYDSDEGVGSNYETLKETRGFADHTFVKIGDEDIVGFGKKVNSTNTEIAKNWLTDYLEGSGRIPTEFNTAKKDRNYIHVLVGSLGSGTGGNGLSAFMDIYEERGTPYIAQVVVDTTDGESANNAIKTLEGITERANTRAMYETIVSGVAIEMTRSPLICNIENNLNENLIHNPHEVDVKIMTNILAYSILMSGNAANYEISDIENNIYGVGTSRDGLNTSVVTFGYLTPDEVENQVTAMYFSKPNPTPDENALKVAIRGGIGKAGHINGYPLTVPMTISGRKMSEDKSAILNNELAEAQKALATMIANRADTKPFKVQKAVDLSGL